MSDRARGTWFDLMEHVIWPVLACWLALSSGGWIAAVLVAAFAVRCAITDRLVFWLRSYNAELRRYAGLDQGEP